MNSLCFVSNNEPQTTYQKPIADFNSASSKKHAKSCNRKIRNSVVLLNERQKDSTVLTFPIL